MPSSADRFPFHRLLYLGLAAWIGGSLAAGALPDPATLRQMEAVLASAYSPDEPGAAVIVVRDGEVLFREARGMANLELGVPLKPEMAFRLGSITKQFTAAAILMLQEQGKLAVEDEITHYLPDYPTHGHTITIEHLLTHTSGIFSYTSIPGHMGNPVRQDLTTDELVALFKNLPMDFAPGTRWRYNNSGYVLLGAIIEKASGKSYADFVRENIFEPLGMQHSYYGGHQLIPNRVSGYSGRSGDYANAPYLSMTQPHAAGSLLSNVDDLATWNEALTQHRLISQDSYRRMTTKYRLNDGEETTYGYGLGLSEVRGRPSVEHGGGIYGFSTMGISIPDEKIYVAVLSNNPGHEPGPEFVARKLAALALGDPFPEWEAVELPESLLRRYVGVYRIDEETQRTVTVEDGKLYTLRSGGRRQRALPASETRFFYENSLSWFDIVLDEEGEVRAMHTHQQGTQEAEEAIRVSADVPVRETVELDAAVLDRYVGIYQLAPNFNITVTREGSRLFAQATSQPRFEIFAESETRFFLQVVDAQITFVTDDDGRTVELTLHQGGRDTPGKKIE